MTRLEALPCFLFLRLRTIYLGLGVVGDLLADTALGVSIASPAGSVCVDAEVSDLGAVDCHLVILGVAAVPGELLDGKIAVPGELLGGYAAVGNIV
jgi:hypothetical protein